MGAVVGYGVVIIEPHDFPIITIKDFKVVIEYQSRFTFRFPYFLSVTVCQFQDSPIEKFFTDCFRTDIQADPFTIGSSQSTPFIPSLVIGLSYSDFISEKLGRSFRVSDKCLFIGQLQCQSVSKEVFNIFFYLLRILLASDNSHKKIICISCIFHSSVIGIHFFAIGIFSPSLFYCFQFKD